MSVVGMDKEFIVLRRETQNEPSSNGYPERAAAAIQSDRLRIERVYILRVNVDRQGILHRHSGTI